jgi:hypothetical protein
MSPKQIWGTLTLTERSSGTGGDLVSCMARILGSLVSAAAIYRFDRPGIRPLRKASTNSR